MKRASFAPLLLAMSCVPDERPPTPKATTATATRLATPARPRARETMGPAAPGIISIGSPRAAGSDFAKPAGSAAPPSADPALTRPLIDTFERPVLGPEWIATTPAWRLEGGRLCVEHAKNHPIWLRYRLPLNARITFDVTSSSEDGDIKAEYWGDGHSAAETVSYNAATSYLTIFGGWKNQFHVLARIDEHAKNRPELRIDSASDDPRARPVAAGRSYHFKVTRDDGRTVHWYVDDLEILSYPDPEPLAGAGHDHFGFNDWDVRLCFDNLAISPLP